MARITDHLEADRDHAVGKPATLLETPWTKMQPDQRRVDELRDRARARLAGQGYLSREDIQDAVARMILGPGG
jgi:hypothetical protein